MCWSLYFPTIDEQRLFGLGGLFDFLSRLAARLLDEAGNDVMHRTKCAIVAAFAHGEIQRRESTFVARVHVGALLNQIFRDGIGSPVSGPVQRRLPFVGGGVYIQPERNA